MWLGMSVIFNVVSFLLCWMGSSAIYLAANTQMIMRKPLSKPLAWLIFATTIPIAFLLLLSFHHWVGALLIVLIVMILLWLVYALVTPYFVHQTTSMLIAGAMSVILGLLGGEYHG